MSSISEIFNRTNLQQLREFLHHGVDCVELDRRSYEERIESARCELLEVLEQKFPDMEEREQIANALYRYAGVCEDVYMEIGICSGAQLTVQLLQSTSPPPVIFPRHVTK